MILCLRSTAIIPCNLLKSSIMTLPELCECGESPEQTMPSESSDSATTNKIGQALKAVLQQASSQGRVTCSLTSSVELLSTRPDDVMLCVMPLLSHPDASATIQSTLIRAVCLEHNIRVLSVDCDVKLAKTVCLSETEGAHGVTVEEEEEVDDNCNTLFKTPSACSEDTMLISSCDNMAPVMGFPCVLVQYPTCDASAEDEMVAEFCKEQLFGQTQQEPYIEIPD